MSAASPQEAENQFQRKLKRAHLSIVKDAGKRTCGGCAHAALTSGGVGHCTKYTNYDGNSLAIYRSSAPACRQGFQPAHS